MMHFRLSGLLVIAAVGLLLVPPATAQVNTLVPRITYLPINSSPSVPAGLKVTCMQGPNVLTPSKTCPVVQYQGVTTWIYSFIDNQVSVALVSYDAQNKVVRNVTKNGARYVWTVDPITGDKTIKIWGQSNQSVSATWAELGSP
jgi:hypothetical protein